jgi:integrase
MTLAEVGQLVGSGLTPWWRAFVTVGVMCGLRRGELTGLRWQDGPSSMFPPASALRVNRTR